MLPTNLIKWRASYEDMTVGDEFSLISVEKGEEQKSNVRAVHISIRHDDDAVVSQSLDVEFDT